MTPDHIDPTTADGRLARGARSRRAVTRHAVDVASVDGLDGLSIGRLAADLGVSKSGVQTLFKTKEQLQLATIETAREAFLAAVVRPVEPEAPGLRRLDALLESWLDYAAAPLFPGGCFWTATLPEFDSRPGAVRDALLEQHRRRLARLAAEVREARSAGDLGDLDPELTAFTLHATLAATNVALRLGEPDAVVRARQAIDAVLRQGGME